MERRQLRRDSTGDNSGVIGLYFFKNDVGDVITVSCKRYRMMITNFLWFKLNDKDIHYLWFQQGSPTSHIVVSMMGILKEERFQGVVNFS